MGGTKMRFFVVQVAYSWVMPDCDIDYEATSCVDNSQCTQGGETCIPMACCEDGSNEIGSTSGAISCRVAVTTCSARRALLLEDDEDFDELDDFELEEGTGGGWG